MKIIAGRLKSANIISRKLSYKISYRPTESIVREAIFNILCLHFSYLFDKDNQCSVADICSGSGSLAFEAISRGIYSATLVEMNKVLVNANSIFIKKYNILDRIKLLNKNALFLEKAEKAHDLIFIDPPYNTLLLDEIFFSLKKKQWINEKSVIVCQCSVLYDMEKISSICDFTFQKVYKKTKVVFVKLNHTF